MKVTVYEAGVCFYNNITTRNSFLFTKKFEWLHCGGKRWIRTTEVVDVRFTV